MSTPPTTTAQSSDSREEAHHEPRAIARNAPGTLRSDVSVRTHTIVLDEPVGTPAVPGVPSGTDLGPTPVELLAASLAGCVAMTVRMYADRKQWKVNALRVETRAIRNQPGPGPLDAMEVGVALSGDLSPDQVDRLHDIATKCPVSRTLAKGIEIRHARLDPA
ncbi:MAG: OsmC family protein [Phycisphaerales bacterium]|jgi:putative redox protein|nr:OsmC family protein [Phycisphaerales bacterium]